MAHLRPAIALVLAALLALSGCDGAVAIAASRARWRSM